MSVIDRLIERMSGWVAGFVSASVVAAAAEAGRTPDARDLRRLGIDPRSYLRIGHD